MAAKEVPRRQRNALPKRRPGDLARAVVRDCVQRTVTRLFQEFSDSELVRVISCRKCHTVLTQRGMSVSLCLDENSRLFSTDLPRPGTVRDVSPTTKAPKCLCNIRTTRCQTCDQEVGYRVLEACAFCLMGESDNGHYWLFNFADTVATKRRDDSGTAMFWGNLTHNGSSESEPLAFLEPVPDSVRCPICCQVFYEPVTGSCGHAFCRGCIEHELDIRPRCPLDRQPLCKVSGLTPAVDLAERVEHLPIHCRYGLKQQTDGQRSENVGWDVDPEGCFATFPQCERRAHEPTCPFRSRRPYRPSPSPPSALNALT
jgi:hypothetical protein